MSAPDAPNNPVSRLREEVCGVSGVASCLKQMTDENSDLWEGNEGVCYLAKRLEVHVEALCELIRQVGAAFEKASP